MSFYESWWWLHSHPINLRGKDTNPDSSYGMGMYDLDIFVTKVNPTTNRVENAANLNTHTRVWLEFGPWQNISVEIEPNWQRTHDPDLDCGGDTFEEAIINLAGLVKKKYGDYSGD